MVEEKKTTISITYKLMNKLKQIGKMGESYEEVILRLIENQKK